MEPKEFLCLQIDCLLDPQIIKKCFISRSNPNQIRERTIQIQSRISRRQSVAALRFLGLSYVRQALANGEGINQAPRDATREIPSNI